MVKVTLNENLVPCKDPWVKGNPDCDLTRNVLLPASSSGLLNFSSGSVVALPSSADTSMDTKEFPSK